MNYVCGYLFLLLKDGREFLQINPSENMNKFTVTLCAVTILKIFSSVKYFKINKFIL